MTDQELNVLEQIWKGKSNWGPEFEPVLDRLEDAGYVEIIKKQKDSTTGQRTIELILVRITTEGEAHLSSSGY